MTTATPAARPAAASCAIGTSNGTSSLVLAHKAVARPGALQASFAAEARNATAAAKLGPQLRFTCTIHVGA